MTGWKPDLVMIRLAESMAIQRRVVDPRVGPGSLRSAWPTVLRHPGEDDAETATKETTALPPTREELALLERTEEWLRRYLSRDACVAAGLVEDTGWVLVVRALGWPYRRIGQMRKQRHGFHPNANPRNVRLPGGNSRPSLVAIELAGLDYIAQSLNRRGVPVDPDLVAKPKG